MKTSLKIMLTIAGMAASVTMSAQAGTLTYNFNDGTMQGWENLRVSKATAGYYDAQFGPAQTFGRDGWGGGPNPDAHADGYTAQGGNQILDGNTVGAYFLSTTPYAATKGTVSWGTYPSVISGVHQSLVVASPAFTFDGSTPSFSYLSAGGHSAGGPILNSLSAVPVVAGSWGPNAWVEGTLGPDGNPAPVVVVDGNNCNYPLDGTRGNGQVSLMDASTGAFVLSKQFGDNWTTINWTSEELSPFVNDGRSYQLVMVDWLAGQSANFAMDNIVLNGVTAIPEPSTFALLGLGGLALLFRRRK